LNARVNTLLVFVVAIAVAVASCGGDDDSNDSAAAEGNSIATSSLSKKEFVKQATDICEREREDLLAEVGAYFKKHENLPEGAAIAGAFKAVMVPSVQREIAAFRKLGAPEGDEERIEGFLVVQEEGIDKAKRLKSAKSLSQFVGYFESIDDDLRAYGLPACARTAAS
jgi:hypothetical protein